MAAPWVACFPSPIIHLSWLCRYSSIILFWAVSVFTYKIYNKQAEEWSKYKHPDAGLICLRNFAGLKGWFIKFTFDK